MRQLVQAYGIAPCFKFTMITSPRYASDFLYHPISRTVENGSTQNMYGGREWTRFWAALAPWDLCRQYDALDHPVSRRKSRARSYTFTALDVTVARVAVLHSTCVQLLKTISIHGTYFVSDG